MYKSELDSFQKCTHTFLTTHINILIILAKIAAG